jgi:ferredoxin
VRIAVDEERCIGSGQCVLTEPDVFDQSEEDGTVVLLTEQPDTDREQTVRDAVRLCPSQALSLIAD